MSKHRVPTWVNICWLTCVLGHILLLLLTAVRRDYDFVQTLGLLTINFGMILAVAIFAGAVLYGLSILFEGVKVHKSNCDDDDNNSGYGLIP